jgi:hypothetical protein
VVAGLTGVEAGMGGRFHACRRNGGGAVEGWAGAEAALWNGGMVGFSSFR